MIFDAACQAVRDPDREVRHLWSRVVAQGD